MSVLLGLVVYELARRCCHGCWAPAFCADAKGYVPFDDGWCIYCDSGQST